MLQAEHHFIDVGYCDIWSQKYFVESTQNKTPIIFVHGGPGLESGYIINLKELGYDRPCIFYDQSGCGKSVMKSSVAWTLDHYVKELALLINKLGVRRVILFGYSWGAAIATKYTLEHPESVEKLILASPYLSTPHLIDNYKKLAQSKGIYETIRKHEKAGTTDSIEYKEASSTFFKNFIFTKDPSIFNDCTTNQEISEAMWGKYEFSVAGNLKNVNLIPLLHGLSLPVLLTAGRSDTMTPEYMQLLHSKIPSSDLITFEHSAHMPHIEEEEAYCRSVSAFLSSK